ncbi:MAG: FMN-binding glutamate synthase family protein [Euryarchaeota archaeon]|nr:FMN-binding glutamate synthase family protein [Euryarchaeota archaeon]
MNEKEVQRKAASGAVRLSSGGPGRPLPGLWSLSICPAQLAGRLPADIFEGVETDVVIGEKTSGSPLSLMAPFFVPGSPFGEVGRNARLAFAYGTALAGVAFGTGEGGVLPEEVEICRRFHGRSLVSWGPARHGVTLDFLRAGDAVVIEAFGHGRGCSTGLWRQERTTEAQSRLWGMPAGKDWVVPPAHLDMEFPEDLKQHVNLLREVTDHRVPVIVKLGASRVQAEVRLAVESGADAVWVEALESPLYGAPDVLVEEAGVPLLAVFGPARRAFEEAGAKERGTRLLVSGGISDGAEAFKALALGADAIGLPEASRVAIGCSEAGAGDCHAGKCPAGIATTDPRLEAMLDWKSAGQALANYLAALNDELKLLTASAGHTTIHAITAEDLRALTYDAASLSGVKLAGYDRVLPMWMH